MGSRALIPLVCVLGALITVPFAHATPRDDSAWLQAKLDAGGSIFLPKLPNGQCYRTRGLWLTRDDTSVDSDGACIVALGPGEARLNASNGKLVRPTSVFLVDHSNVFKPLPVRVAISNLDIRIPAAKHMDGITIFGGETTLEHVRIGGSPRTDVVVGRGHTALGGSIERTSIRDCVLTGARLDVVTVTGPIGFRIEGSTLSAGRAAGLDLRAADRGQPVLDVHVLGNTIADNGGPGILADLAPKDGPPVFADGIEIGGNQVLRNARAGILVAGGQDDGNGQLVLTNNVVRGNHGAGIRGRKLRMRLVSSGNDLRGNRGGAMQGLTAVPALPTPTSTTWTPPPSLLAAAGSRDDTAWLQARLDTRGGTIFLPKLAADQCYATHGLWVSHDYTTITSNGACIASLGRGPVRLHSNDGDPISAEAVFYISQSSPKQPAPVHVAISNLRIIVPPSAEPMYGVSVYGHDVTLSGLDISGSPEDDVTIGSRNNANGYDGRVAVVDSTLSGATRNAVSATSVVDLRIEGNTIEGVRDLPPGEPAAGIDVEPNDRDEPMLDVRILRNTIQDNAGPGILLPLETNNGPTMIATGFEISGNTIVRNSNKRTPPTRAGIAIVGGQDGGEGTLSLTNNVIRDNGGPGILTRLLKLIVHATGNEVSGNSGD